MYMSLLIPYRNVVTSSMLHYKNMNKNFILDWVKGSPSIQNISCKHFQFIIVPVFLQTLYQSSASNSLQVSKGTMK